MRLIQTKMIGHNSQRSPGLEEGFATSGRLHRETVPDKAYTHLPALRRKQTPIAYTVRRHDD
jgi:hypothetical protein